MASVFRWPSRRSKSGVFASMKVRRILPVGLCICALAIFALWVALRTFWPIPTYNPATDCFLVSGYSRTNGSLVVQVILTNRYHHPILYQDPTGTAGPGVKVNAFTGTGITNFESGDLDNAGWFNLRAGSTRAFSVALPGDTASWQMSTALLAPSARMRFRILCTDLGLYKVFKDDTIEAIAFWFPNQMNSKWDIQSTKIIVP